MSAEREVAQLLDGAGAALIRTNGHKVYRFPNGQNWITPSTPSDHHAWKNNLADLRRKLGIRRAEKKVPNTK